MSAKYPEDGARTLLRTRLPLLAGLQKAEWDMAHQSTIDLVEQCVQLAEKYGLNVKERKLPEKAVWSRAWSLPFGDEKRFVIAVRLEVQGREGRQLTCNQVIGSWVEDWTGQTRGVELQPALIYDFAESRWYGPLLDLRDPTRPGAPRIHRDALETFMESLLDAIGFPAST